MSHDNYKQLELQPNQVVRLCPVCSAAAELWQYSESPHDPVTRVVMCSNGEPFGPQNNDNEEGCLLYMPPDQFYKATAREAIKYWNDYFVALISQRLKRDWETHKAVLRREEKT